MTSQILGYVIVFAVQTGFLALALWIMIKIQKQQFNVPGLLGSAAIASGLDMIPYVGHYLAVPVLLLCVTKLTHEEYTDVLFTVMISYALMFCMNLFLVGSLMGDLRPDVKIDPEQAYEDIFNDGATNDLATSEEDGDGEQKHASATNALQRSSVATNIQAASASIKSEEGKPAAQSPASSAAVLPGTLCLKSLIKNGKHSTALIDTGVKTYTLMLGDTAIVQTKAGKAKVQWQKLEAQTAILDVDGKTVQLSLPLKK